MPTQDKRTGIAIPNPPRVGTADLDKFREESASTAPNFRAIRITNGVRMAVIQIPKRKIALKKKRVGGFVINSNITHVWSESGPIR